MRLITCYLSSRSTTIKVVDSFSCDTRYGRYLILISCNWLYNGAASPDQIANKHLEDIFRAVNILTCIHGNRRHICYISCLVLGLLSCMSLKMQVADRMSLEREVVIPESCSSLTLLQHHHCILDVAGALRPPPSSPASAV